MHGLLTVNSVLRFAVTAGGAATGDMPPRRCGLRVHGRGLYDLVDGLYDHAPETLADALPSDVAAGISLLLLAQETLTSLDLPAERCLRACAALAQAGRRALAGQTQDYALRQAPPVGQDVLLAVLRRHSGTLAPAPAVPSSTTTMLWTRCRVTIETNSVGAYGTISRSRDVHVRVGHGYRM